MPNKATEALEWFWLFQDAQGIADLYYGDDYQIDISEDGLQEAECIWDAAWERFEESSAKYRRSLQPGGAADRKNCEGFRRITFNPVSQAPPADLSVSETVQ